MLAGRAEAAAGQRGARWVAGWWPPWRRAAAQLAPDRLAVAGEQLLWLLPAGRIQDSGCLRLHEAHVPASCLHPAPKSAGVPLPTCRLSVAARWMRRRLLLSTGAASEASGAAWVAATSGCPCLGGSAIAARRSGCDATAAGVGPATAGTAACTPPVPGRCSAKPSCRCCCALAASLLSLLSSWHSMPATWPSWLLLCTEAPAAAGAACAPDDPASRERAAVGCTERGRTAAASESELEEASEAGPAAASAGSRRDNECGASRPMLPLRVPVLLGAGSSCKPSSASSLLSSASLPTANSSPESAGSTADGDAVHAVLRPCCSEAASSVGRT